MVGTCALRRGLAAAWNLVALHEAGRNFKVADPLSLVFGPQRVAAGESWL